MKGKKEKKGGSGGKEKEGRPKIDKGNEEAGEKADRKKYKNRTNSINVNKNEVF